LAALPLTSTSSYGRPGFGRGSRRGRDGPVCVELGIGLILAFLLLSLLVSGLNEGLNRLFSIRSKFLWAFL
jgi:hypothetical protein